jgi:hypothetical protein
MRVHLVRHVLLEALQHRMIATRRRKTSKRSGVSPPMQAGQVAVAHWRVRRIATIMGGWRITVNDGIHRSGRTPADHSGERSRGLQSQFLRGMLFRAT